MQNISKKQLKELMATQQDIVLIDVRTALEVYSGIIPTAMHIDYMLPTFCKKVEHLAKNKAYYVYCRSGNRSELACSRMESMGFTQVFNLSGGITAWDGELSKEKPQSV